jgi:hypothetical protein
MTNTRRSSISKIPLENLMTNNKTSVHTLINELKNKVVLGIRKDYDEMNAIIVLGQIKSIQLRGNYDGKSSYVIGEDLIQCNVICDSFEEVINIIKPRLS